MFLPWLFGYSWAWDVREECPRRDRARYEKVQVDAVRPTARVPPFGECPGRVFCSQQPMRRYKENACAKWPGCWLRSDRRRAG